MITYKLIGNSVYEFTGEDLLISGRSRALVRFWRLAE